VSALPRTSRLRNFDLLDIALNRLEARAGATAAAAAE
jgi:hypothetical protein